MDTLADAPRAALQWLWDEFQWPSWASGCCISLCACLMLLHIAGRLSERPPDAAKSAAVDRESAEFRAFQRQYLVVYFLVMFADWLQGTHMYSLYESYGMNISALFLTGFLSSAVLGNVVGPFVDKYGRRSACLVFCALEIIINALENLPSMPVLLLGRVLGGVSTSLLFSAFESWMVTEHRARGFSEEWIAKTFAIASEGNGLLAVLAGIVAQLTADAVGEIGPFRLAVAVTAVAMLFILPWKENYGSISETKKAATNVMKEQTRWRTSVYAVGLCYSLFEGAMYVFVFLWYPTLYAVVPGSLLPSGLVFSSFMVCIAIGGKLYDMVSTKLSEEKLAIALCSLSAVVFIIPVVTTRYEYILAAFLVFETSVGAFSPCCGTLRSRYFPNERLSTILGTFRLPTNIIVVLGTGGSNYVEREQLFLFCSATMVAAGACGIALTMIGPKDRERQAPRVKDD